MEWYDQLVFNPCGKKEIQLCKTNDKIIYHKGPTPSGSDDAGGREEGLGEVDTWGSGFHPESSVNEPSEEGSVMLEDDGFECDSGSRGRGVGMGVGRATVGSNGSCVAVNASPLAKLWLGSVSTADAGAEESHGLSKSIEGRPDRPFVVAHGLSVLEEPAV